MAFRISKQGPVPVAVADPPVRTYAAVGGGVSTGFNAAAATGALSVRSIWETQPSVRKVVNFMAETVSSLPWRAYLASDGGRERLYDSRAETLVRSPSRFQAQQDLVSAMCLDYLLYGTSVVVLMDGELVRVPPPIVTLVTDVLGRVVGVRVASGAESIELDPLPVALMTGWNPDGSGVVAPVRTLRSLLEELTEAEGWRRRMWSDTPRISAQVLRPVEAPRWTDEKRERFIQAMQDFKSSGASGSIPVMEDGMQLKEAPRMHPDSGSASEVRTLTDVEVAGYFGVPPELLGMRAANYGGYAALRRDLYTRVLGPLISRIEAALNSEIVPALDPRDGVYGVLDRTEAQDGTQLERLQALQAATGKPVMTVAEARERLDLPPLPGTDELGSASSESSSPAPVVDESVDEERDEERSSEYRDPEVGNESGTKSKAASRPDTAKGSRALLSVLLSVRDVYARWLAESRSSWSDDDVLGFAADLAPLLSEQAVTAANGVIARAGNGTSMIDGHSVQNYIQAMALGKSEAAVKAARELIDGAEETEAVLGDVLSPERRELWADSSAGDAAGFGSHEGAVRAGYAGKVWRHTTGTSGRQRAAHVAMDGEEVGIDDVFSNGMRWPKDWGSGDLGDIAGCNCEVEYFFDDGKD